MRKSLRSIVFMILFLFIASTPSLGMLLLGPSEQRANEARPSMPKLFDDGKLNTSFLSELSSAVSNSFFLRSELITAYDLALSVMGQSAEEDVILGRDGWLYYKDETADYTATELMSERDIFSAAKDLLLMQEYCEGLGAHFLFFIAPNKSSVYPEYMPTLESSGNVKNAEALHEKLTELSVNYVDLFEIFSEQKEKLSASEALYFKHDSHWNSKGAALAADALLSLLSKESDYFNGSFSDPSYHEGDLFEMLYPSLTDEETDTPPSGLDFEQTLGQRADSITIETEGNGEEDLLMYRDSFGELLYPYMADAFSHSRFSRLSAYDLTKAQELESDVVIIELVERNLSWLIEEYMILPAPKREAADVLEGEIPTEGEAWLSISESGGLEGYTRICGNVISAIDTDSPVYIGTNEDELYEAMLLRENGFTALLPEGIEGEIEIYWENEGKLVRFCTDI